MAGEADQVQQQGQGTATEAAVPQGAATGAGSGGDRPAAGNKFLALMDEIGRISEPKPDGGGASGEDGKDGAVAGQGRQESDPGREPEAQEERAAGGEGAEESDGEAAGEGAADKGDDRPYTILGGDGKPTELPLPEGAKIRFPADGRQVEASFDELVRFASMGVHANRRLTELGQERKALEDNVRRLQDQVARAERILERVLTDDDAYDKARRRFLDTQEKLKDPEYREGLEAKRKLSEREQQEQQQLVDRFWNAVDSTFREALPQFPYLRDDDYELIVADFTRPAEQAFEAKYAELIKSGRPEEEAIDAARKEAAKLLTPDALRKTMEQHNDRIASRLPPEARRQPGGDGPARKEPEKADPQRQAEEHNKYIDEKRRQREQSRSIRQSGGALNPAAQPREPGRKLTFDERMRMISEEIDRAKRAGS